VRGSLRFLRLLPALVLILGTIASVAPASPVLAATTITDCPTTEGALQTDISNAGAGGTVRFDCSSPTTIHFSSANGGTGNPITIGQDVTLDASTSPAPVTFDGDGTTQLFIVNADASLTFNSLTLQNASPTCSTPGCGVFGGAIRNNGTLTITDSTLSGNSPPVPVPSAGSLEARSTMMGRSPSPIAPSQGTPPPVPASTAKSMEARSTMAARSPSPIAPSPGTPPPVPVPPAGSMEARSAITTRSPSPIARSPETPPAAPVTPATSMEARSTTYGL